MGEFLIQIFTTVEIVAIVSASYEAESMIAFSTVCCKHLSFLHKKGLFFSNIEKNRQILS